jgi:hypothetical protein
MKGAVIAVLLAVGIALPCQAEDAEDLMEMFGEMMGDEMPAAEGKDLTVEVLLDEDKIIMKDGTEIEGTVLLKTEQSTIILTDEGEETVRTRDIEEIVRGRQKDTPVTLPVREADGYQFIVMEPIEGDPAEKPKRAAKKDDKKKDDADDKKEKKDDKLRELDPEEIKKLLEQDKQLDEHLKKMKRKKEEETNKKTGGNERDEDEKKAPPVLRW